MKIVSFAPNYRRLSKQTARETNRRDKYPDDEDEQEARERVFNQAALFVVRSNDVRFYI